MLYLKQILRRGGGVKYAQFNFIGAQYDTGTT